MPRHNPSRRGSNQHAKGKKRPRGWHRRKRLRLEQLVREIRRKQRKEEE